MIKKFIDKTFVDIDFTIYHITSVVFLIIFILIYILIFSVDTKFVLNKNKYYVKHSNFFYTDDDGKDFKNENENELIVSKEGKIRILLISFLFAVAISIIIHGISILLL